MATVFQINSYTPTNIQLQIQDQKKENKNTLLHKYSGNYNGYKLSQPRKKKGLKVHSVFLFKRQFDIENIYGQEKMAKALKKIYQKANI